MELGDNMGRFLSRKDMQIIRRQTPIEMKRRIKNPELTFYGVDGETKLKIKRFYHVICGCGVPGCFFISGIGEENKDAYF